MEAPTSKESYDIGLTEGILDSKHLRQMGMAIWLYMWLVRKATKNENGVSIVLGGKPMIYADFAINYPDTSLRTYKLWLEKLREYGNITTKRTPRGLVINITKGKKAFKKGSAIIGTSDLSGENAERSATFSTSSGVEGSAKNSTSLPSEVQDRVQGSATSGTSNIREYKESIKHTTHVELFTQLTVVIGSKAKFSSSYDTLLTKALKDFTPDELLVAAKQFSWKFNGGSDWHTSNRKFFTMQQFLGNDSNHIPRYQICFEEAQQETASPTPQSSTVSDEDVERRRAEQQAIQDERHERIRALNAARSAA